MTKIIIIYILLIFLFLLLFINYVLYSDTFGNSSLQSNNQNYTFIKKPDDRNIDTVKDGIDLKFDDYNNQHNYQDTERIKKLYNQKRTTYDLNKSTDIDNYYNPNYDNVTVHNNVNTYTYTPNTFDILTNNIWIYLIFIIFFIIIILFILWII